MDASSTFEVSSSLSFMYRIALIGGYRQMATQPPPTATLPIERTADYRHVVADQVAAIFLGSDYDLAFMASAPRPMAQQQSDSAEALLHVEGRIVETVRVRMNGAGLQIAITSLISGLIHNPAIDLDAVQRDVVAIIDSARRSRTS